MMAGSLLITNGEFIHPLLLEFPMGVFNRYITGYIQMSVLTDRHIGAQQFSTLANKLKGTLDTSI
jgi:hypothetical protein